MSGDLPGKRSSFSGIFILVIVLLLLPGAVSAAEQVTNGGFETGTLDGWTMAADNAYDLIGYQYAPYRQAHTGSYGLFFDCQESGTYDLSQEIDLTDVDHISFYSTEGAGLASVKIDAQTVISGIDDPQTTWSYYTIDTSGLSGPHVLHFIYQGDGGGWVIDDISATSESSNPVPEFPTMALPVLIIGALAVFAIMYRKK